MSDVVSHIHDPKVFGPGNWQGMHRSGRNAITEEKQHQSIIRVEEIAQGLPCSDCRDHAVTYLTQNPIRQAVWKSLLGHPPEMAIFIYTWLMHNDVNRRIGHPLITLEEALKLYPLDVTTIPGCNQRCQRDLQ